MTVEKARNSVYKFKIIILRLIPRSKIDQGNWNLFAKNGKPQKRLKNHYIFTYNKYDLLGQPYHEKFANRAESSSFDKYSLIIESSLPDQTYFFHLFELT